MTLNAPAFLALFNNRIVQEGTLYQCFSTLSQPCFLLVPPHPCPTGIKLAILYANKGIEGSHFNALLVNSQGTNNYKQPQKCTYAALIGKLKFTIFLKKIFHNKRIQHG